MLYFIWSAFIKFGLDVYKLRRIPGPVAFPIVGNLYEKTPLTSVRVSWVCVSNDGSTRLDRSTDRSFVRSIDPYGMAHPHTD